MYFLHSGYLDIIKRIHDGYLHNVSLYVLNCTANKTCPLTVDRSKRDMFLRKKLPWHYFGHLMLICDNTRLFILGHH